ncbi:MAG: hypothetical protein IJK01_08635 [Clostridia bacterium]|nr:hypothetical protein [Clostridia bacterium]
MSRRDRTRTIHPRFLLFVASVFILLVSVVLLIVAIVYGSSSCAALKSCSGSPDALTLGSTVIETEDSAGQQTAPVTKTDNTDATLIDAPPALQKDITYSINPVDRAKPAELGFTYDIRRNNREDTYTSNPIETNFSFGTGEEYTAVKGITTFAGNNYRNTLSYGTATISMQTMTERWSQGLSALGTFSGVLWTGQPLIVTWEGETLQALGVLDSFKRSDSLTEVIQCAADGMIYFYDLESGTKTREPISVGASMFGTPTLDPRGIPMLYIGQGTAYETNKSACYGVNLVTNSVLPIVSGKDHTARRDNWSAFDSSPLIVEDTLIWPSENGLVYLVKLNTAFDPEAKTLSITPGDKIKYRYQGTDYTTGAAADKRWYGYESSVTAFRNYLYLADNGGRLQCVDVNTLKLQFVVDLGNDADASIVLEEDGGAGTVWLYASGQTDAQDESLPRGYGYCYTKKINGLTGQIVWEQKQLVQVLDPITGKSMKGGCKATPAIGRGTVGDLLICAYYGLAVDTVDEEGNVTYGYGGKVVAYNRSNGEVRWEIKQLGAADYVSSPLLVYTARGDAYLITCDRSGAIRLYRAVNPGENSLYALSLGDSIEATPAAYGNYICVATTGTSPRLYCLRLQ